jgi:hypothetical protein
MHEVSDVNKESIRNWTSDYACYILANNLSMFCLCPENLWKTQFKGDGLISLGEEISRQHSIQDMSCLMVPAFLQVCNENESKTHLRKI